MREWSNENTEQSSQSGVSTVATIQTVSQLVTANYISSEIITFETQSMTIEASKISSDINYNKYCGRDAVTLSDEYIQSVSYDGNEDMICTFITTNYNLHLLSLESIYEFNNGTSYDNPFQTNFVSLDITSDNNTAANNLNFSKNENNNYNNNNNEIIVSKSDPFIITFNVSNTSYFTVPKGNETYVTMDEFEHFPVCSFYNNSINTFDTNNCYLLRYNSTTVTCFCLHLTDFGCTWSDFTPKVNFLSATEWENLSLESIWRHPLGLIVVTIWIFLCTLGMCLLAMRHWEDVGLMNDRPLVAETDENIQRILSGKDLDFKLRYRSIQEARLMYDDAVKNRSCLVRFWHLFVIKLRNDHLYLGVCVRQYGTHFTSIQRVAILMVRLLTTLGM